MLVCASLRSGLPEAKSSQPPDACQRSRDQEEAFGSELQWPTKNVDYLLPFRAADQSPVKGQRSAHSEWETADSQVPLNAAAATACANRSAHPEASRSSEAGRRPAFRDL